ncbi:MAG: flagellar basal body P-ring protein FlgI, partial [Limnochordia bacterium]
VLVSGNTNVEDLVNALNAIGASAQDIIAILQAIKAAGALYGDLIIM